VFHGFIRWTLVLLMALLPPCLVAVLELPLTLSATVLLLVATLVSAWSLDQVTDCWTRTALPEIRGPWGLPRVGIIRGRPLTLLPTLLPILVAVPLAVASTGGRRLLLACVCMALVVAIPRISWWWSVLGVLVVVLLGGALGIPITESLPAGSIMLGFVGSIRSTLWLTATVRDIEELRADQGRLAVAEERLRFARDLHDVTGRDLSAITVKAELVAQLAERADARAADQAREVATIARDSPRALVRGYREVDLAVELQGTASLLRSAGIEVTITGEPSVLDPAASDRAAWLLREAGTNILRHADATVTRIDLSTGGIRVSNDGVRVDTVRGPVAFGNGLTGLEERLGSVGVLRAEREAGRFTLTAQWEGR
jgi:two-component system sensor histidine kinase DesK